MMILRTPQLDAFRAAAEAAFIEEMNAHFRRFTPPLYRSLGRERAERAVGGSIERAVERGYTKRGSIRLYVEMDWIFGTSFHADPQIPWAGEVLSSTDFDDELRQAGRLEHLCREYLAEVHGPRGEHADAALRKLEAVAPELQYTERHWRSEVAEALSEVFPTKAERIGPEAIGRVLDSAEARGAELFGADEVRGRGVLALLMFSFGAGCLSDPYYPWIGETAQNPKSDGHRRAEALERKAVWWLRAVNEGRLAVAS